MSIYTLDPTCLMVQEVSLFLRLTLDLWHGSLFTIVWPVRPSRSPLDELALGWFNAWSILLHVVLIVAQIAYLGFVLFAPVFAVPAVLYFIVLAGFVALNYGFCSALLNGRGERILYAGREYSASWDDESRRLISRDKAHAGERWLFINGVAAGSHWTKANLSRLAKTFRRPILGIHNPSYGIVFDVIECCLQRTWSYPTLDIRDIYAEIVVLLRDPEVKKVVLIAHSQGAIEAGMALDWCFATIGHKELAKIEVYTFGNASNRFNSPKSSGGHRLIQHVEHYANRSDWVSRFGVLAFRGVERNESQDAQQLKARAFVGKLFINPVTGHQMNQHYLDNMFTMDAVGRSVDENNTFMGAPISATNFLDYDGRVHVPAANPEQPAILMDESRLWTYRNGGTPSS